MLIVRAGAFGGVEVEWRWRGRDCFGQAVVCGRTLDSSA